jgi:hypothetical protein
MISEPLLKALSPSQREFVSALATAFDASQQTIQLEKLLKNAIPYIQERRVRISSNIPAATKYEVRGNTATHYTRFDKRTQTFQCDCPLFLGKPPYEGQAGECSHIMAVRIFQIG